MVICNRGRTAQYYVNSRRHQQETRQNTAWNEKWLLRATGYYGEASRNKQPLTRATAGQRRRRGAYVAAATAANLADKRWCVIGHDSGGCCGNLTRMCSKPHVAAWGGGSPPSGCPPWGAQQRGRGSEWYTKPCRAKSGIALTWHFALSLHHEA